jgi:hypothetical protein
LQEFLRRAGGARTARGQELRDLLHPSNRQDSGCSSTGVPGGLSGDSQRLPA